MKGDNILDKLLPYILLMSIGILIGLSITHQIYLENLTGEMLTQIQEAETAFNENDIEKSSMIVKNSKLKWEKSQKNLGMVLNHEEIYIISEKLTEIEKKLKNFLSNHDISANFAVLKLYIKTVGDQNKFVLENIL